MSEALNPVIERASTEEEVRSQLQSDPTGALVIVHPRGSQEAERLPPLYVLDP
jgi:hypothetical protein